jgi:tetratricopeptide repeat protein
VRRPLWFLLALSLAALAALAATVTPPNLAKALETQRQLTEKRPEDAGVWNDYGNLLLLDHRPDEAEAAYRHAVELDPKKVSALFNLGLLEEQRGHRKEALALFEQVIANDPRHAWAHFQIGAIDEAWGRDEKAIDAYSRAFALDPQLAFRDVNPQVVESKLVTQAMLKAYREGARSPEAPKIYDDPNRIAALLVPPPAAPTPESTEAAGKPDAKRRPQAAPGAPAAPPGVGLPGTGNPGAAQKQPTVLREGNIERGSPVGQALPPGQTRRPPPLPGPSRGTNRVGVPAQQPWQRPIPNVDQEEEEGGNIYVPPPPTPPPAGVIYQPGLPSSGRLDVRVMPPHPSRRPERVAALATHRG